MLQALVSTVEARELWPVLLSKAVYKLYHLTGARALHPDLLASNSEAAYHSDCVTPCLLQLQPSLRAWRPPARRPPAQ